MIKKGLKINQLEERLEMANAFSCCSGMSGTQINCCSLVGTRR